MMIRREIGQCHDLIAVLNTSLRRPEAAMDSHTRAVVAYRDLAAAQPNNPFWRRLVGVALGKLANTYAQAGRQAEASRSYERAREQFAALSAEYPRDIHFQTHLAQTLHNLALVAEPAESVGLLREVLVKREAIVAASPNDHYLRRNVARTRTILGEHLVPEQPAEALA